MAEATKVWKEFDTLGASAKEVSVDLTVEENAKRLPAYSKFGRILCDRIRRWDSVGHDDDAFVRKTQEAQLESLDSVRVPGINNAPSYAGCAYAAANPRETSQRKPWDNYKSRTPVDSGLEELLAAENPPTKEEKGSNGPF